LSQDQTLHDLFISPKASDFFIQFNPFNISLLKEPAAYLYTASVSPASALRFSRILHFSSFRSSSRTYLTFVPRIFMRGTCLLSLPCLFH
ncbi:MAG: hypothetical protein J5631_00630, partial [Spirochaetaceae bacterium]|nr:hypothetical protein [Spirochaetaceae bacterium]